MNLFNNHLCWMNEPEDWRFLQNQVLEMTAPPFADFFIDPSGDLIKSSAPFMHTSVKGNFILTTLVCVSMKSQYDSGCLMIMDNENNWSKLCFEFYENKPTIISIVTKGTSDDSVGITIEASKVYLKIIRYGLSFAFHYSLNNQNWFLVRYFSMDCQEELKVGCVVQSPTGDGCKAQFDFLDLKHNDNSDVRQVL